MEEINIDLESSNHKSIRLNSNPSKVIKKVRRPKSRPKKEIDYDILNNMIPNKVDIDLNSNYSDSDIEQNQTIPDMTKFDDSQRNQINVAIIGSISVGKSTLLNTIFAETYSDCKYKRTTMTPQIYYESGKVKGQAKLNKEIRAQNTEINKNLNEKSEKGETITMEDIKETHHIVSKIHDFSDLEKNIYLTIYDIPGLNDSVTKQLYFKYMEDNFHKFDIIIFVVDIHSSLNTSDETDILVNILKHCKTNSEQFGIHNKLIILGNKCDDMYLADDKKTLILEEELADMKKQLEIFVKQKVDSIFPEIDYKILPISSEDSYIYRVYSRNKKLDLDIKYINKFGQNEYGKTRWNTLSESKKKEKMNELLEKININETLKVTGFNGFKDTLNGYLSDKNQKIFVNNHLSQGIQLITGNTKIDISDDIQKFYEYFTKYNDLSKRIKVGINTNEIFTQFITNYLKSWITNILKTFIHQVEIVDTPNEKCVDAVVNVLNNGTDFKHQTWKLIQDSYLPHIKEANEIIKKANDKDNFNGRIPIINKLEYIITSSINNHYVDDINNKTKSVGDLFGHFGRLIKNKYKITKDLIGNFFSNEDMINKPANEIIEYINKLEKECSLSLEDKQSKVLDILKKIYTHIGSMRQSQNHSVQIGGSRDKHVKRDLQQLQSQNHNDRTNTLWTCADGYIGNFNYLEGKYIPSYMYYSNIFWNKYIMFNDSYDGKIDELNYISFMNNTTYGDISFNLFVEKKDELCVLENYYVSLLKKPKFIVKSKKKTKLVFQDEWIPDLFGLNDSDSGSDDGTSDDTSDVLYDNDGNLSDDLDKALGIL
jgi:GTPase Era involved in 16S rRNA processing